MKYISIVAAISLLASCATLRKDKSAIRTHSHVVSAGKTDSAANTIRDSSGAEKTAAIHKSHTVSAVDTIIQVGADSSNYTGSIPDTGQTETVTNGDITNIISVDRTGKLHVGTQVAPKSVPVFKTVTTDVYDSSGKSSQATTSQQVTVEVAKTFKVDSSEASHARVKEKTSHVMTWWAIAGLVVAIIVFIIYRYLRSKISWFYKK